ncbi:MAG: site-specific integrase [Treponema sp.]|jgi:site-specific recombinase XerD|nr:site-specific integrase [Treponema sp.]
MEVIYSFYERDRITIPVTVPVGGYNSELFSRLLKSGAGWDKDGRRFIFSNILNSKIFDRFQKVMLRVFSGFPHVYIDENSGTFRVAGFFGRPWRFSAKPARVLVSALPVDLNVNTADLPGKGPAASLPSPAVSDANCLHNSISLPEMFSSGWADKLKTELHSRKYSPRTINSYLYYNRCFCRHIQRCPEEVMPEDVRNYLAYLDKALDLSASSMNLAISSLKFFYVNVMKRKNLIRDQRRPRHDKKLPAVLSGREIERLLECETNPKHRLLLMLAYSSGLRVSEVVAIRKEHIDFSRRMLLIHAGKGRRDRYTLLSDRAADFIRQYCALYAVDTWLFPGFPASCHLSIRTAQTIFSKALEKAGISKPISIHGLRHTFATHLLENGINIRYIQELLGHTNLRTTQRYTHIARRQVFKIRSPLDSLSGEDE